jgi:hypothetical protein
VLTCPSLQDRIDEEEDSDDEDSLIEQWTPRFRRRTNARVSPSARRLIYCTLGNLLRARLNSANHTRQTDCQGDRLLRRDSRPDDLIGPRIILQHIQHGERSDLGHAAK